MNPRLPVLFLFFCFSINAQAQTKEDLIECLKLIFSHPEMEIIFENSFVEKRELIIKTYQNSISDRRNQINKSFSELRDDDFRRFERSIKFMTKEDAEAQGILEIDLTTVGINGDENELRFNIFSRLKEERKKGITALFLLQKKMNTWKIISRNVNVR